MISLYNAECLEKMKDIPDNSADMVLCDPPYGTTKCKWDSVIPFDPMWEQLNRVCRKNAAMVFTASQPFTSALIMSNAKMFKHCWVWNKKKATNFALVKRQPLKVHEDVCVFGGNSYTPEMSIGATRVKGGYHVDREFAVCAGSPRTKNNTYYPKSIIEFSTASNKDSRLHPTQKPVDLMRYLIRTYTNDGDTVLDFTMGSGTTGVACILENRSFIGIEFDDTYFNVATKRIMEALR